MLKPTHRLRFIRRIGTEQIIQPNDKNYRLFAGTAVSPCVKLQQYWECPQNSKPPEWRDAYYIVLDTVRL